MFKYQRSTSYTANAVVLSLIVIGILAALNFMGSRHTKRFDFTEQKLFSLAPQSIKVVKSLKDEVKITGFFKAQEKPLFDDLVNKYTYHSNKIKVNFIDPDKDVAVAKQYKVKKYQTIIVERGKRETRVEALSEEKLTNAIIQVGKDKIPVVYFTKGHQEKEIQDTEREGYAQVRDALKEEGYEVKDVLLLEKGAVPSDCDVLILAGPQKPFLPKETEVILEFLKKGGSAMVLLDPENGKLGSATLGIESILTQVGITAEEDVVIDPIATIFGQNAASPVVSSYGSHDIVKEQKLASFYPLSRSLTVAKALPNANIKVTPIAKTSPSSWGETASIKAGKAKFDEGKDRKGPLNLAVAAEGSWTGNPNKEDELRLVVFGDSDFVNNGSFEFSGNGNLFLNSVAWLNNDVSTISIRPTAASSGKKFVLTVILVPLAIVGSGVGVWWFRRKTA
ncbi:MAG: GldG family protein [Deltaproteobacteria bacterium]|nr:GldG family protein [Deltaproteobacteria bacterium]